HAGTYTLWGYPGGPPPGHALWVLSLVQEKVPRLPGRDPATLKSHPACRGGTRRTLPFKVLLGGTPEESKKPRRTFHRPARFHMLGKVPSQAVCPRAGLSPGRMGSALSRRVPST